MSVLIFSDIHASKEACLELEKLLPNYDKVFCCGDIVGYGKDPEYCIDFIRKNNIATVKGNHDAMVLGEFSVADHPVVVESVEWTQKRLSAEYKETLRNFPNKLVWENLFIKHTLAGRYIFGEEDMGEDINEELKHIKQSKVVIGHSHVPFCFTYREKTIFNPSSITKGRKGFHRGYGVFNDENFESIVLEDAIV